LTLADQLAARRHPPLSSTIRHQMYHQERAKYSAARVILADHAFAHDRFPPRVYVHGFPK
jgi:hypothetical protein